MKISKAQLFLWELYPWEQKKSENVNVPSERVKMDSLPFLMKLPN